MSDTKISVEFVANTAAAVSDIAKLSDATREQVTAGDLAGSSMKELGKELQRVRAAQLEATEATRKSKDLMGMHSLTIAKFGADSKEAAESQAKLSRAQEEAQRTGAAAAEAMSRVARAVGEAGTAADGKMTPAAQRAAQQLKALGAQAERNALDMKRMELQSGKTAGGFDLMGAASGKLMAVLGPAALIGTLTGVAGWLGDVSEKTLQYETALANLPFALDGARAATHGLMSESTLAVAASQALALGVVKTQDQFDQLAGDAAKIALKLGTSTEQMLGDLTSALGRGSAAILDNAGIIVKTSEAQEAYALSIGKTVSELTEAEKKYAFQVAAMDAIRKSADSTKVAYDSNAAAISRLKVTVGDAWSGMERSVVNSVGSVLTSVNQFHDDVAKAAAAQAELTREAMRAEGWSAGFKELSKAAGLAALDIVVAKNAYETFAGILNDPKTYDQAAENLRLEREREAVLSEEAKHAERVAKALEKQAKAQEDFLQAQVEHSLFIGPMPAPKPAKKKGPAKKDPEVMDPGDVARARVFDGRDVSETASRDGYWQTQELEAEAARKAADDRYQLQQESLARQEEYLNTVGDMEFQAQEKREALLDRRLQVEHARAQEEIELAKDEAARERAKTRLHAVEEQKRLVTIRRFAKEEAKEQQQKVRIAEKVTATISDLGSTMADAAWESAEGTKGAGLQALGDYLKTVSKQMSVKALVETALGVSALAGVVTAGLAPGHFGAAAVAAAAAMAAGGAGAGLSAAGKGMAEAQAKSKATRGKKWEEQHEEREAKKQWEIEKGYRKPDDEEEDEDLGSGGGRGGGRGGSGRGGSSDRPEPREMEAQDVPISYFDRTPVPSNQSNVYNNFDLSGGFWASGGPEAAGQELQKLLRRGSAAGRR